MATTIARLGQISQPINLTSDVSTTGGFSVSTDAGALLMVDSKSAAGLVTLTFYAKSDSTSTDSYVLVDASGSPVGQIVTAAGQCFPLPDGMFAARHVLVVVSSGTAVVRVVTKG